MFFRMDSSINFLTRVYISFSVTQHDVTHHPTYQPEFLSSRTVSSSVAYFNPTATLLHYRMLSDCFVSLIKSCSTTFADFSNHNCDVFTVFVIEYIIELIELIFAIVLSDNKPPFHIEMC
jgi:hypothetical protein